MANAFVNFLKSASLGSGNLRDYQHASRLYLTNYYELTPKAGWIYYVELIINPKITTFLDLISSNTNDLKTKKEEKKEFIGWYSKNKNRVGLLAKSVGMPKFNIATETLNQYNRKTVIQKSISYQPISIVFHDDMANVTTNLWKSYYQYYYGDSIGARSSDAKFVALPKYQNTKYQPFNDIQDNRYGLNNQQTDPFFISIDVYQLYQQKYTSFKIVNPLIKDWKHDDLDQTQGSRLLTNSMTLDYETVIYNTENTSIKNNTGTDTVGFVNEYYDKTPSPLSIGGQGTVSILGKGGIINGAKTIFGNLGKPDISPLGILQAALQTGNLVRNASNISLAGVLEEGSGVFSSVLSGIEAGGKESNVVSGALQGLNTALKPAGIEIPLGSQSTNGQTSAQQVTPGSTKK
jgi:hypothetical protein